MILKNLAGKLFIYGRPPYTNNNIKSLVSKRPQIFNYYLCMADWHQKLKYKNVLTCDNDTIHHMSRMLMIQHLLEVSSPRMVRS